MIDSRSIEPKAPAYRATVSGVIEAPTMPRAPEIESMRGASDWGTAVLSDHFRGWSIENRSHPAGLGSIASMFEIEVNHQFSAAHQVSVGGVMEELHGHDWRVTVVLAGPRLDEEDLLLDFHALERSLVASVEPFAGRTMNGVPPFDRVHPTAERLAEHVGMVLGPTVPAGSRLVSVSVREAPGCIARWIPDDPES